MFPVCQQQQQQQGLAQRDPNLQYDAAMAGKGGHMSMEAPQAVSMDMETD